MTDNDDYMAAKTTGNTITELMWDRLQENTNANRRFRIRGVAGGDDMRYDSTKVVWDSDIYIYFTKESDGSWVYNKINSNPTTGIICNDNDLLYVTLNDTTATVLTVDSEDYTAMPTDDTGRILVLGSVSASTWYGNIVDVNTGQMNLNNISLTSGTATGIIMNMTAGASVAFPNLVYIAADGDVELADASSNLTMPAVGIALETKSATQTVKVLLWGYVYYSTWSWTVGGAGETRLLYVDDVTAGGMTQNTGNFADTGDQVQVVATVVEDDYIIWNPSYVLVGVN